VKDVSELLPMGDRGLSTIQQLSDDGVNVANGSGTVWQIAAVSFTLVVCGYRGYVLLLSDPIFLWLLPPILLAVDFLSGFVHWFFDSQVEPSKRFLGRIALDFLDHHVRPGRTAQVGFFASAWRPALMVSLPLIILTLLVPMSVWLAASIFWLGFLSMLVPQTHKEAHLGRRPFPIGLLQKTRLIINPVSHQAHHDDNTKSFCVFTGWLNPLLDYTRFWRGMECVFETARRM